MNFEFLYRKKHYDSVKLSETKLLRVLNTFDLTTLGVGFTFGGSIYIVIGDIISKYAGPSILFSFFIAGLSAFLSGLCYAELGARVPRSGSAYVYIYVTIGEFLAFIIGWDLILEYMIACASTSNALSLHIDAISGYKISNTFKQLMPMSLPGLNNYPDLLAFFLTLLVVCLLVIGVKESVTFNKAFTCLNVLILTFICIVGSFKIDFKNWNLTQDDIFKSTNSFNSSYKNYICDKSKEQCGIGGLFPFGFYGVIKGAAKCFYCYIGFDTITSTGEEVKNPQKALPKSIIFTLIICTIYYLGVSTILTLMMPYYIIDPNAGITSAFEYVKYEWAKYIVFSGAVISLITCLYSGMFPLPRIVYAMANDGLIYKVFTVLIPKFKTPIVATIVIGFITAVLATIFSLEELIEMTSIGTLLAYILVSTCVLILRYRPDITFDEVNNVDSEAKNIQITPEINESFFKRLFKPSTKCNEKTSLLVTYTILLAVLDVIIISAFLTFIKDLKQIYAIVLLSIFSLIFILLITIISCQPQNLNIKTFKVPCVQLLPLFSVFVNIYLMMSLSLTTWMRFFIWLIIGIIVYFSYGIRNSLENNKKENRKQFLCFNCPIKINDKI